MISVAIATYNGEKYVKEQLASILHQTRQPDEVVISDDASTDKTVYYIKEFIYENNLQTWRLIINKGKHGFNGNFYNAISHTKGNIIFLADQDDVWLPNKIEVMAKRMESYPDLLLLSSSYSVIDGKGETIIGNGVINAIQENNGEVERIDVDSQICCSYLRGCAMCFQRQVFEKADWENLSWTLGHDWTLSITASLLGKNEILKKQLFQYRFHENNTSLTSFTRKNLLGDVRKRVEALEMSIKAHKLILSKVNSFPKCTEQDKENILGMIRFEEKRYIFLKTKCIFKWIILACFLKKYRRYYKSMLGGIKIWIGDLLYAYNINFKIK